MDSWASFVGLLVAVETTLIAGIWGFAWFLSTKFNGIYEKIQATLDLMINKLEYHEQHDDKRFNQVTDSLWALRLEQATNSGKINDEKR
jgi:hypothetical protein